MIELADWHWIFWINVPIGLVLAPLAARKLDESYGPKAPLDFPGLGLVSTGLFGLVYGLVRAQTIGWTAPEVMISLGAGIVLLAAFVRQELRTESPMLPMQFFAKRSFAVTNVVSMAMYFGMFGSIFFLSQFMQNVLGNTPLQAGLKLLVWTGATMVVAPLAGIFSEKFGPRWFMVAGVSLQAIALAWLATEVSTTPLRSMIVPFVLAGSGMALVFAPSASAILNSVRVDQAGQASGATNAIREVGGTFGIAVLATVFSGAGAYTSPRRSSTASSRRSGSGSRCSPSAPWSPRCCPSGHGDRGRRRRIRGAGGARAAGAAPAACPIPARGELGWVAVAARPKRQRGNASRRPSAGTR